MKAAPASHLVDSYIEALPPATQALACRLRELLFDVVPQLEERFSYRLPFYHYHGMFCYLHHDKAGLHLCFCRGKDLVMAFPQLEQKGRATIASVTLQQWSDIQRLEVQPLLMAAAEWNREAARLKIPLLPKKQRRGTPPQKS